MADDINPAREPQPFEIDAWAAFVEWLATADVPPRVLELLTGPTRFKLYRGTKDVTFDDYQRLVDTIVHTLEKLDGREIDTE